MPYRPALRPSESPTYKKNLRAFRIAADALLREGYDQALYDMLRALDEAASGHGVDFVVNANDILDEIERSSGE